MPTTSRILVAGATGYIGGRLVPRLLELGYSVRCLVRDPARVQGRDWANAVELVTGDVLHEEDAEAAMHEVDAVYYLVHSMAGGSGYHARDVLAAGNVAMAARRAGVRRIIYLGGLAEGNATLSEHLRSRNQTGEALRASGVPVTEFRAGVIVGSGSLSFEIIRYLTERVPVMICPRWVFTRTQPIGIRDVLHYLTAALHVPESAGRVIEIGGADAITYYDMMTQYAEVRGLRRLMLPVPVLTPRLSSWWVDLVTPVPAGIARPLIEGLRNETIVRDHGARSMFPDIVPSSYRVAVERALARLHTGLVETAWSDALSSSSDLSVPVRLGTVEGMIIERRELQLPAPAAAVHAAYASLGGRRGWLYMNWAWTVRGFIDRLVGGVGVRRGRRHPTELRVGDALDFWRVEAVEDGRLLRLRAEMIVPGNAWLQFHCEARDAGQTLLVQTAYFAPKGLSGWLYWYALYPIHALIFSGLIRRVALLVRQRAESKSN